MTLFYPHAKTQTSSLSGPIRAPLLGILSCIIIPLELLKSSTVFEKTKRLFDNRCCPLLQLF